MTRGLILTILSVLIFSTPIRIDAEEYLNKENEELLCRLDSLLAKTEEIDGQKEAAIKQLRQTFERTHDTERRYWLAVNLYEEYAAYDSDSAMTYANHSYELAKKLNRVDFVIDAELNRAYLLSATGLLDEALQCLQRLDEKSMSDEQLRKFCERHIFLSTHRDQYIGGTRTGKPYPERVDSLIQDALENMTPADPNYGWIAGWGHMKDEKEALKAIKIIKPMVDSISTFTRDYALDAYILSKLYEYAKSPSQRLKYLILSAMADIRSSVKEIASLQEIAAILTDIGELERANSYINYCFTCANRYKSRVRLGQLAVEQERALGGIYRNSQRQAEQNRNMMGLMIVILGVLVLALLYIIRQMRQLSGSRRALGEANEKLQARIGELQQTREELHRTNERLAEMYDEARRNASTLSQTNEAKEKYIANIFTICSDYITKLDDFRKNIYRMIVARRFDELRDMTKTPELSHSEIKELYVNFDRIFLQIYPDFVADFNTLLRPEERIDLRSDDTLNTELRIYALVRLGMSDSVNIAKFLHISTQTVYNTRQRARNKAAIPKDKFAEAVKSLGKSSI